MKYEVIDAMPTHILVRFEDESLAKIEILKGWTKEQIEEEISKFMGGLEGPPIEYYENVDEMPLKIGDTNDIESYYQKEQRLSNERMEEAIRLTEETNRQIKIKEEKLINSQKNRLVDYKELRQNEYPNVADQLDALYHAGIFPKEMEEKIRQVKEKYPKDMTKIKAVEAFPKRFESPKQTVLIDGEEIEVPAEAYGE